VDRIMTPGLQDQLVEVHPEVSFAVLAGGPMSHAKRTAEGCAERLHALRGAFAAPEGWSGRRVVGTQPDDVLDAVVVAWSARRLVRGEHLRLGGDTDERGLRMEIVV
jgi:predicted RNase H-like nuclease